MAAERSITGNRQKETLENFRKYLVPSMLSMMLMAVPAAELITSVLAFVLFKKMV